MYAVIPLGSRQYKVEKEKIFFTELVDKKVGEKFEVSPLLVSSENGVEVGTPSLTNIKVSLEVVEEFKAKKIRGFIYKRRKNYHKAWGHRQRLHKLKVLDIS